MNKKSITNIRRQMIFSLLIAGALLLPQTAFAASTGTALLQQNGGGCVSQDGDYVTLNGWVYQFYIEVPSGLTHLRVQLFDADIGRGRNGGSNDFLSGTWNTACRYTLYNPSDTQVATFTGNSTTGTDNGWMDLYNTTSTPIASGHWRLVTNMTSSVTTGDETNGFGIRADDGNEGSAGTELNIYALPFLPLGRVNSTFYPWATSGCTVDYNDFDGDSTYSVSYSSRMGAVSGTFSGSANNAWANHPASMADDFKSIESGLWTAASTLAGSNIITFYTGNYAASNPPPSSQSEANTFRIYFPRDGGGKPNKPVFSQKISYISGPNPPQVGQTTRVRVELIIFNPAAQAITFSAANRVTAEVPGGGVVYAGNPIASPGTVVSQPMIGGTGPITWNPGPVSGNNTYATLYYYVDVTPPSGARLPVTGSPGSNGTSATYLDETGATFTYGPLCELAVTAGGTNIPTWVAISCFEADVNSGQPTVEWHTAAENGTVGFYLWRQDASSKEFQLVNPNLLPAVFPAMIGGVYRLVDPHVQYGETVVYRLEEITARGDSLSYGPFTVTFDSAPVNTRETNNIYQKSRKEIPDTVNGFQSAVFAASQYEKSRLQARSNVLRSQPSKVAASGSGGRAKIAVKSQGLYYIDAASIAAALDRSLPQVEGFIASHFLSLSSLGEPVAWLAAENHGGIYFYGEKLQSLYSDQNIYWLEPGLGMDFTTVYGGNAAPAADNQTFSANPHYEENYYPLPSLFTNPEDDFWFWDLVMAGPNAKVLPIWVSRPATTGTATLTVNLYSATDTPAASEHHARFFLNNKLIGESWWDGINARICQFSFDQSILMDGKNTFIVNGKLDGGVKYSYFYLNSIDLSYQQYYQATNNALWCQGENNQTITATGFTDAQILVLDISEPRQPKLVNTSGSDQAGRLTFVPKSPANKYLVVGLSCASPPFSVRADSSTDLKRNHNSYEYLLIAPKEFATEAGSLADYRRSQGLTAEVVSLEDIYYSFNYGLASPLAIKDFLNYARAKWGGKALKYAVLVGKGTFDYKNYLGANDNLLPVILAATPDGLFAADNLYGDLDGYDGIPEIAVSRLPVVSVAELRTLINKIKAYDDSQGSWTDRAIMINDNADGGGDFPTTSYNLSQQLTGYAIERISLLGYINAADVRAKIIAGFNAGAALITYVGHGGLDQLAEEDIFNIADLPLLHNFGNLPFMVFVTCAAGRFDIPGYVCMSEALLVSENGGIVAALAPLSAAFNAQSNLLVEEFYKAIFSAQEKDVGTAWLSAAKNFILQGGKPYVLNIYSLQGDPAVMVK